MIEPLCKIWHKSDALFIGFIGAGPGIAFGIGLAYLLSTPGASGGRAYIAPIFLPNEDVYQQDSRIRKLYSLNRFSVCEKQLPNSLLALFHVTRSLISFRSASGIPWLA